MLLTTGYHHVSIPVTDLARAKTFYREILGLKEIPRPPFDFPGAWFAIGENGQQLHLIVHDGETRRAGGIDTRDGHFALRVPEYEAAIDWLNEHGLKYRAKPDSITGFAQIFLLDPDHNIIELNAARSRM
ncbi:VOC family protein [Paenibacillus methanolicus]|uniref:Catechol 2,3-dioxygenase-like lactoylglutathione lyase family enzyme n=1 Tax=Paenibacillus methanolicus TaxID=582686 RepID=A0A5S5BWX7_9BACL|nr:VOC family protein [Paenibacillus methanolicus]TYP70143.1 catechol 2,3-dioxygenase-like lactoylglutathione lyase family enzyme [Paenibacillus methanolicus]